MAAKGLSTINTKLLVDSVPYNIKSYPDLFGTPDMIEVTDEEDDVQKFVPGVQSADAMDFTMNYLPSTFRALKAKEGRDVAFVLNMGEGGKDGSFTWTGQLSIRISGGEVNAPRDMVLTVYPDSDIRSKTLVYLSPPGPYYLYPDETLRVELVSTDPLSNVMWSVGGTGDTDEILEYEEVGEDCMACDITGVGPGEVTLGVSYVAPENQSEGGISFSDTIGTAVTVMAVVFTASPSADGVMIYPGESVNLGVVSSRDDVTFEWTQTGDNTIIQGSTVISGPDRSTVSWSISADDYQDAVGDVTVRVNDPGGNVIYTKTWAVNYIPVTPGEG